MSGAPENNPAGGGSSNPYETTSVQPGNVNSNRYENQDASQSHQRRSYEQQNSSNLNDIMGTVDPNILHLENKRKAHAKFVDDASKKIVEEPPAKPERLVDVNQEGTKRVRQPPGGFSSGLW